MSTIRTTSYAVFACHSAACAPPPAGKGGSLPGTTTRRARRAGRNLEVPDEGFTLSPKLVKLTTGFAVALDKSDRLIRAKDVYMPDGSMNPKIVQLVKNRLTAASKVKLPPGTKVAIGGWHNPEDGKVEINVTVVFPRGKQAAAARFAKSQNQISFARLHDPFEIIDAGGTGGERNVE